MSFGIGGKPYINLDNYIDLYNLDNIHPEICRGLAKADPNAIKGSQEIKPNSINPHGQGYEIKPLFESHNEYQNLPTYSDIFKDGQDLDYNELTYYLKYCLGGYDLHTVYKLIDENTANWSSLADYFPELCVWIENLHRNIFSKITDVTVIALESAGIPWEHKDPNSSNSVPEFIHVRQSTKRPFYILDNEGNKTYIKSRVSWFNETCWHGGYPINSPTYNIRIDGSFTECFKSQILNYD